MAKPKAHLHAPEGAEVWVNGKRVYTIEEVKDDKPCDDCEWQGDPEQCPGCTEYIRWEPKE